MDASAQAAQLEADEAAFDAWVAGLGGFTSERYGDLRREAIQFAGPAGCARYLQMAMELDEDYAEWKTARAAARRRAREARAAEAAAAAVLERSAAVLLAMGELRAHPRLAADPDFSTGTGMSSAEVALELRASLGLANRAPTAYVASLPEVDGLSRRIGLRP